MSRLSRRTLVATSLALTGAAAAPQAASADTPLLLAQSFITQTGKRVIAILKAAGSSSQKTAALYALVRQVVAIDQVGLAALGTYQSNITPSQRTAYLALFHRAVYFRLTKAVAMITDPSSIRFRITATKPHHAATIVETAIHDANQPPAVVGWRIATIAGTPRIIDVSIQGISMLKTVRASYTSVITDHAGNIEGLIAALRRQVHQT